MRGSVEDKIQATRTDSINVKKKNGEKPPEVPEVTILKEGYMDKESSSKLFHWRSKYCVLSTEYLTIYRFYSQKSSDHPGSREKVKNILFRFPLDDVTAMSNIMKRKRHVFFTICTKEGSLDLRVATEDREWLTKIQIAVLERRNRLEFVRELKSRTNLFASRKRRNNVRRRSFKKDAKYGDGIGITIKNEGENVIVARVFPEGPAAKKGTIHVGDEIITVDGIDVYGKHAEDVAEMIKSRANIVVLTVKPAEPNIAATLINHVSVGVQSENPQQRGAFTEKTEQSKARSGDKENDENTDPMADRPMEILPNAIEVHPPPAETSGGDVTANKNSSHSERLDKAVGFKKPTVSHYTL